MGRFLFLALAITTVTASNDAIGKRKVDLKKDTRLARRRSRKSKAMQTLTVGSQGDVEAQVEAQGDVEAIAEQTGRSDAFSFNEDSGCRNAARNSSQPRYKFLYPMQDGTTLPLGVFLDEEESGYRSYHNSTYADDGTSTAVITAFKMAASVMGELKSLVNVAFPKVAPEADRYFTAATLGLEAVSASVGNFASGDPTKIAEGTENLFNGLTRSVEAALSAKQKATRAYATFKKVTGNISGALNGIGGIVDGYRQGLAATDSCWKDSQGRGIGKPPKNCKKSSDPEKTEYDAGLCYKPCPAGYKGVGPVCWRTSKGRGLGSIPSSLDDSNQGCGPNLEPQAGLCYQICPDGWKGEGPTCHPKSATDISYGRGAGRVPGCKDGMSNSAGLCYPNCRSGYEGEVTRCIYTGGNQPTARRRRRRRRDNGGSLLAMNETVEDEGPQLSYSRGQHAKPLPCRSGQVQHGALCYPVCRTGYKEIGCCICEADSYDRGLGQVPGHCKSDEDKDAGLCYPKCRDHYKGIGPVCWRQVVDRGVGKIPTECPEGWEKNQGLCYKKCDQDFKGEGPLCHPVDKTTHEVRSLSVTRGIGVIPGCDGNLDQDAGLCYTPCPKGFKGIGPVCWHECKDPLPTDGGAMCCDTQQTCTKKGLDMAFGTITGAVTAGVQFYAGQIGSGLNSVAKLGTPFTMPKCKELHTKLEKGGGLLEDLLFPVPSEMDLIEYARSADNSGLGVGPLYSRQLRPRPVFMYAPRRNGLSGRPVGILLQEDRVDQSLSSGGDDDEAEDTRADVEQGVLLGFKSASMALSKVQNVIQELLPDIAPKATKYLEAAVQGLDTISGAIPSLASKNPATIAGGVEKLWTGLLTSVDSGLSDEQKKTVGYMTYHAVTGNISSAIQGLDGIVGAYQENLNSVDACWKTGKGRGVGTPPNSCSKNADGKTELESGLCYKPCPSGMNGIGPVCWRKSYGRGVGKVPGAADDSNNRGCPADMEYSAGLCYQKCPPGWKGIVTACHREDAKEVSFGRGAGSPLGCPSDQENSAGLCYPKCKAGYRGSMTFCHGDSSYHRGLGKIPSTCGENEDKQGALCYPKCREGYHGIGPVCWRVVKNRGAGNIPSNCPTDHELSQSLCYKKCRDGFVGTGPLCHSTDSNGQMLTLSKNRGVGAIPGCEDGKEFQAGLCYTPCEKGFKGIGPVCWHECRDPLSADGGAMCCQSPQICAKRGLEQFMGILSGGITAATNFMAKDYGGGLNSLARSGSPFALQQCHVLHERFEK